MFMCVSVLNFYRVATLATYIQQTRVVLLEISPIMARHSMHCDVRLIRGHKLYLLLCDWIWIIVPNHTFIYHCHTDEHQSMKG